LQVIYEVRESKEFKVSTAPTNAVRRSSVKKAFIVVKIERGETYKPPRPLIVGIGEVMIPGIDIGRPGIVIGSDDGSGRGIPRRLVGSGTGRMKGSEIRAPPDGSAVGSRVGRAVGRLMRVGRVIGRVGRVVPGSAVKDVSPS
jgi:hypothetical protein